MAIRDYDKEERKEVTKRNLSKTSPRYCISSPSLTSLVSSNLSSYSKGLR